MAVIHISESDAIRDFANVLAQVCAGSEVIIDSDLAPVAVLVPSTERSTQPDAGHDAWFRSMVHEALDDTRPDTPSEEVELHFAERHAASRLKSANYSR